MRKFDSFEKGIITVVGGGLAIVFGIVIFNACNPKTPAEQQSALEATVSTISPRPGVECYILPGISTLNPRTMSCVVVQH